MVEYYCGKFDCGYYESDSPFCELCILNEKPKQKKAVQ